MEKTRDYFLGLITSWTAWLGGLIIAMPEWWPLISDQAVGLVEGNAKDTMIRVMGILVVLIRFKTTQSLAAKGGSF